MTLLAVLSGVGRPLVVGGSVGDAILRDVGRPVPFVGRPDVDVELHGAVGPEAVVAVLRAAGAVVVL